jgi:tetratricopeptide (TPR) repeat protein
MELNRKLFVFLTVIAVLISYNTRADIVIDSLKIKSMADDTAKVNLMNRLADELRDFDTGKGLFYANNALALAKKLNYKLGIGEAHKAIGINYYRMAIYDASLDNNLKAISIFKELNELILLAKTYNNIGLVYYARNQFAKGKNYMLLGLEIANKINSNTERSRLLHNIALIEYEEAKFDKAIENHYKSYYFAKSENNLMLMGYNYLSIGKCYLKLKKLDSAQVLIQESIKIFEKLKNPNLTAMSYNQFADFLIQIHNYSDALNFAQKANKIGESIGSKYIVLEASDLIAKAYMNIKDYENALK